MYVSILKMSKVEIILDMLQRALTYIGFDGMVGKP